MAEPLVLTFDIGTQSARAVLVNKNGDIVAKKQIKYSEPYYSLNPGWGEQRPDFYFEKLCETAKMLCVENADKLPDIIAVTITCIRDTVICLDKDRNIFVGAVNIRHYLNEGLLQTGGHIGDGIRPSERRKGYGTAMVALALEECRKLGIDRVLMCCDKDNIGSAKTIIRNGGVLENEVIEDDHLEQRYWIQL